MRSFFTKRKTIYAFSTFLYVQEPRSWRNVVNIRCLAPSREPGKLAGVSWFLLFVEFLTRFHKIYTSFVIGIFLFTVIDRLWVLSKLCRGLAKPSDGADGQ